MQKHKLLLSLPVFFFFSMLIPSCKTQKVIYKKQADVALIAKDPIFGINQYLSYFDESSLEWSKIEFSKGQDRLSVSLNSPTFFINQYPYLVYPGDSLQVSLVDGYRLNLKSMADQQRNQEFSLLEDFTDLWGVKEDEIKRIQTNTGAGRSYKNELLKTQENYTIKSRLLDSLILANKSNDKTFNAAVRIFYETDSINRLLGLYTAYQDSLKKENLYIQKYREILSHINNLKGKDQVIYGYFFPIEMVADVLLPKRINRIGDVNEFQSCFDTAASLFRGIAKEYVLAKIISRAYSKQITVDNSYEDRYYKESGSKAFISPVKLLSAERNLLKANAEKFGNAALYDYASSDLTNIDKILGDNADKIIFVNFWASWCVPCLEEIPYEAKLEEYFSGKEVVFLNLSIDTDIQKWKKSVTSNYAGAKKSYAFVNFKESAWIKKYAVDIIPRYMVFNKGNVLVNADSPRPSDPKLKDLINDLLSK